MSARRLIVGASLWVIALVGCGSLSDLTGGDPTDAGTDASNGAVSDSAADGWGGNDGGSDGTVTTDAAIDRYVDPCPIHPGENPPRKLMDDVCSKGSDCCSDHCNFDGRCKGDCKQSGVANCSTNGDCCVGFYCSSFSCSSCRLAGTAAELVSGTPRADSCCSKTLNGNNCK